MLKIDDRVVPSAPEDKPAPSIGPEAPKPDPFDDEQSKKMVDEGCPNLLPGE
jgi:hypothetical protein